MLNPSLTYMLHQCTTRRAINRREVHATLFFQSFRVGLSCFSYDATRENDAKILGTRVSVINVNTRVIIIKCSYACGSKGVRERGRDENTTMDSNNRSVSRNYYTSVPGRSRDSEWVMSNATHIIYMTYTKIYRRDQRIGVDSAGRVLGWHLTKGWHFQNNTLGVQWKKKKKGHRISQAVIWIWILHTD